MGRQRLDLFWSSICGVFGVSDQFAVWFETNQRGRFVLRGGRAVGFGLAMLFDEEFAARQFETVDCIAYFRVCRFCWCE